MQLLKFSNKEQCLKPAPVGYLVDELRCYEAFGNLRVITHLVITFLTKTDLDANGKKFERTDFSGTMDSIFSSPADCF